MVGGSAKTVVGGGEPGNELQTPMAIVFLGGLLSATALNMLVLPVPFWRYGPSTMAATETQPAAMIDARQPAEAFSSCSRGGPAHSVTWRRA